MTKRKRRSERKLGSSSRSLPDLFIDRSLGRRKILDRLREVHASVIAHDDIFPKDTDDEVWVSEAGRQRWIVLTKDDRIGRKPGEQIAIVRSGARCFVLHPTKGMTAEDMADVPSRRCHGSSRPHAMRSGGVRQDREPSKDGSDICFRLAGVQGVDVARSNQARRYLRLSGTSDTGSTASTRPSSVTVPSRGSTSIGSTAVLCTSDPRVADRVPVTDANRLRLPNHPAVLDPDVRLHDAEVTMVADAVGRWWCRPDG